MSQSKYILFIDGVCNLCNNLVRFVFNFDKNSNFLFAPLFGKKYQETNKIIKFPKELDTVIVYSVEENKYFIKSEAIKIILLELSYFKIIGYFFYFIPIKLRDFLYDFVAKTRYKVFGKTTYCKYENFIESTRFLE